MMNVCLHPQVSFSVLGFLCMLAMESVGLAVGGAPPSPTSSCSLPPSTLASLATLTQPIMVSCSGGVLTVLDQ